MNFIHFSSIFKPKVPGLERDDSAKIAVARVYCWFGEIRTLEKKWNYAEETRVLDP